MALHVGIDFGTTNTALALAEGDGQGRLIQSIKSHLASASFTRTMIGGRFWTLETLIATYLNQLRGAVRRPLPARAVVGRPVPTNFFCFCACHGGTWRCTLDTTEPGGGACGL